MKRATMFLLSSICSVFALSNPTKNSKQMDAQISGESYLGKIGNRVVVTLGKKQCEVQAIGIEALEGLPPSSFKIELTCDSRKQILWDILKPAADDFTFDDPKFELLWAGDKDGDQKIDLELEMSPKYSCSKKVIFLSSKAGNNQIVGTQGKSKTICGK